LSHICTPPLNRVGAGSTIQKTMEQR
jgi:hypothetical protein